MNPLPPNPKPSFDDFLTRLTNNPTDDDLELLGDLKPAAQKASKMISGQVGLIEVNSFIDKHNRKPDIDSSDFSEASLARRMNGYAKYATEHKDLKPFDKYDLIDYSLYKEVVSPVSASGLPALIDSTVITPHAPLEGLVEATALKPANLDPLDSANFVEPDLVLEPEFSETLDDVSFIRPDYADDDLSFINSNDSYNGDFIDPYLSGDFIDPYLNGDFIDPDLNFTPELDAPFDAKDELAFNPDSIEPSNASVESTADQGFLHGLSQDLGFEIDFLQGYFDSPTVINQSINNPLFFISIDGDFDRFVSIPRYQPSYSFDISYVRANIPLPHRPHDFLFDFTYKPRDHLDGNGRLSNNTTEFLPENDGSLDQFRVGDNTDTTALSAPSAACEPKKPLTTPKDSQSLLGVHIEAPTTEPLVDVADASLDSELAIDDTDLASIDDILANDDGFLMGLVADEELYFTTSNTSHQTTDRTPPDEVGRQTSCDDFYLYRDYFSNLHEKLASGDLKTIPHTATNFKEGDAFVLSGITGFIQKVGAARINNQGQNDPRLRVIYDNGTESNILLSSLNKSLYMDEKGRRVIRGADDFTDFDVPDTTKKVRTGQVYIVRSLSANPVVRSRRNLYKIGFTTKDVYERTKAASRDIAFLESPVEVIATADCYDLNPRGLEGLIHTFLNGQRLQVTLTSKNGNTYHPNEWFTVDLADAKRIIGYIIDGTINDYRMDNTTDQLVKK